MGNKVKAVHNPKIVQLCLDIFRHYLQNDGVFNKDESSEEKYTLCDKSGNYESRKNSHGLSVPVVKMKNGFFVYCSIGFKNNNKQRVLQSISIQFYDQERILFRAEWDNKAFLREDQKPHPQPHWHLEGMGETQKQTEQSSFADYLKQENFSSSSVPTKKNVQLNLSRLHFFMELTDNMQENPCYADLTNEKILKRWLSHCLESINDELIFVSTKR